MEIYEYYNGTMEEGKFGELRRFESASTKPLQRFEASTLTCCHVMYVSFGRLREVEVF